MQLNIIKKLVGRLIDWVKLKYLVCIVYVSKPLAQCLNPLGNPKCVFIYPSLSKSKVLPKYFILFYFQIYYILTLTSYYLTLVHKRFFVYIFRIGKLR